jgi:hypothetical protein
MAVMRVAEAVIAKLAADEIKAWLPSLSQRMLHLAVLQLPKQERERCLEEWQAHLIDVPGDILRFIYSVDQIRAAWKIAGIHRAGLAASKMHWLRAYVMSQQLRLANRVHMTLGFAILWILLDLTGIKCGERITYVKHEKWPTLHRIVRLSSEVDRGHLWLSCLLTLCISFRNLNSKWHQSMNRSLLEFNGS